MPLSGPVHYAVITKGGKRIRLAFEGKRRGTGQKVVEAKHLPPMKGK